METKHTEAVLELLEHCLKHNLHPSETLVEMKKLCRPGRKFEGLNHHKLVQDTRRELPHHL